MRKLALLITMIAALAFPVAGGAYHGACWWNGDWGYGAGWYGNNAFFHNPGQPGWGYRCYAHYPGWQLVYTQYGSCGSGGYECQ